MKASTNLQDLQDLETSTNLQTYRAFELVHLLSKFTSPLSRFCLFAGFRKLHVQNYAHHSFDLTKLFGFKVLTFVPITPPYTEPRSLSTASTLDFKMCKHCEEFSNDQVSLGRPNEQVDMWMDTDGRTSGADDRRMSGHTDGQAVGRMSGRADKRTDERTGGRTSGRTDGRTGGRMGGALNSCKC